MNVASGNVRNVRRRCRIGPGIRTDRARHLTNGIFRMMMRIANLRPGVGTMLVSMPSGCMIMMTVKDRVEAYRQGQNTGQ